MPGRNSTRVILNRPPHFVADLVIRGRPGYVWVAHELGYEDYEVKLTPLNQAGLGSLWRYTPLGRDGKVYNRKRRILLWRQRYHDSDEPQVRVEISPRRPK